MGFIGQAIARLALSRGFQVTGLSLGTPSQDHKPTGITYLEADLSDQDALNESIGNQRFDYVINGAGYIDHQLFSDGGQREIDSHLIGLWNLVRAVKHETLRGFLQIGSSDEYGDAPSPQIETAREKPISPYSFAKAAASHFLQMLSHTEHFPAVTARLFLVYGPGQNQARFLPQIISGCLQDRQFPVSKGEQLRDFCYIDDVASGIMALLDCPKARGEVVNVASGEGVEVRRVIALVREKVGMGRPQFGQIPYRIGENMSLYADIAKMQRLTGWRPATNLDSGIEKTIAWYAGGK